MSNMTDAEVVRGLVGTGEFATLRKRIEVIADSLEPMPCGHPRICKGGNTHDRGTTYCSWCRGVALAKPRWRNKPPDSEGDWLRNRGQNWQVFGVLADTNTSRIHQPGDRWLKLPPTVPAGSGTPQAVPPGA